jgi:CBS domain-containing protein
MAGIADLMVTNMVTARPEESVAEVARRMTSNRIGAVLVVKNDALWGLFSERDLVTRVVEQRRDPQTTDVGDVATRDLVTIEANAPVKAVLAIFREKKFRHLPVMRAGRPVGILSTRDFLEYLVDGLERYIEDLRYKRGLAEGVDPYDHLGGAYGR